MVTTTIHSSVITMSSRLPVTGATTPLTTTTPAASVCTASRVGGERRDVVDQAEQGHGDGADQDAGDPRDGRTGERERGTTVASMMAIPPR
ncbi:hypothetical protein GCM10027612_57360 [Microbispora bryophytorum subsp. camponoti]